jgi:nucleoside-diphosphate-sugar epimerase
MNVLVVGGAGYVGGPLCDYLLSEGHKVKIIDLLIYEKNYFKPVELIKENILNWPSIKKHVLWADGIVWLAALVGDPACAIDSSLTKEINVNSLVPLLKEFKGRLIFPSTCSVYGAQDGLLNEQSPLNPLSLYAKSKIDAENLILDSNVDSCIFRLGTLFGVGDTHSRIRLDLVVNLLTVKAFFTKKMTVFGGEQFRPLLHVRDVGKFVSKAVINDAKGIYNIHQNNYTITQISEIIKNKVPLSDVELTETQFQDARNYSVTSNKLFLKFDELPKITIDEGVDEILNILKESRISDISDPSFSNWQSLRKSIIKTDNEILSISSSLELGL